ncbi:MAG: hypothetical protein ACRD8A_05080 [Candidatus Acidiferrales bacterium]
MSSGFNTDVRVDERVYHVQTEDRGPSRPVIDTMVYQNGRVVHRRNCNYKHFVDSVEFTPEGLRERVEEQHRCVIEDLRSGALNGDKSTTADAQPESVAQCGAATAKDEGEAAVHVAAPAAMKEGLAPVAAGIRLQLLNPESWLTAGSISLQLEILRRTDQQPQSAAQVEALIEGSLDEARHGGTADENGRVQIHFPMPKLGKGGLALVIQAKAHDGTDELRYVMRSNPRAPVGK